MNQQQYIKDKPKQGKLYHLLDYKRQRPFFTQPMRITIDDPKSRTYYLVKNIVYKDKQILALKGEEDPDTIILVEAIIEEGQLKYISMLPKQILKDIGKLFM